MWAALAAAHKREQKRTGLQKHCQCQCDCPIVVTREPWLCKRCILDQKLWENSGSWWD